MPIKPDKPHVIPEVALDNVWVVHFMTNSSGPNTPVTVRAMLQPYAEDKEHQVIAKGDPFEIDHVLLQEEIESSKLALIAYEAVLAWLDDVARRQGKI